MQIMSDKNPQKDGATRRNVIKASVAATALSGFSGVAAASRRRRSDQKDNSVQGAGVEDEFTNHLDDGEFDQAFQLLEENEVEYTRVEESPDQSDISGDSDDVSDENYFNKSPSSVNFYTGVWNEERDEYGMGITWQLSQTDFFEVDGPAPDDVVALAFEDDIFGYKDDSIMVDGTLSDPESGNSVSGLSTVESEPGSAAAGAPSNGAVVKFDDSRTQEDYDDDFVRENYPEASGYVQLVMRKQNTGTQGIVSGLYAHNWSYGNIGSYPILENVSWTIPGTGISISSPTGGDQWTLPGQDGRDEDI